MPSDTMTELQTPQLLHRYFVCVHTCHRVCLGDAGREGHSLSEPCNPATQVALALGQETVSYGTPLPPPVPRSHHCFA